MKRKVLLVNNYDMAASRKSFLQGNSPGHHQFGTNTLIDSGKYEVDYRLVAPERYNNRLLKLFSLFSKWIALYTYARNYDVVYGAADFTVDFLGLMKKLHLFKPKLVCIFHHPPFAYRLKAERFDALIFLGMSACRDMAEAFPDYRESMHFLQWGPDLEFYKRISPVANCLKKKEELIFISNGKTHRDHEMLVTAAQASQVETIIVCDERNVPANYTQESTCVKLIYQNAPNDVSMVKLLSECSVLVIPTFPSRDMLGPIGLTSFVDAIAMGMPLIVAHNTVFADIVEDHKLGMVYQSGDADGLTEAMLKYKANPDLVAEYGRNSLAFGESNDMNKFGQILCRIFDAMKF